MKNNASIFCMFAMVCLFLISFDVSAQISINKKNCIGTWRTVDDETGNTKSHVQIFKKGDKIYAKIIKLLDPQSLADSGEKRFEDIKCDKCPDGHGKDEHTIGLEMVWDMYESSDKWKGGSIMDPKKGKVYTCTMWMDSEDKDGDTLYVRGWIAMFYRTQKWYRVK